MKLKGFITGFICACILMMTLTVFAEGITQKIDVLFDTINIAVNGEQKNVSNLLYNGSTYIKLRDLSYVLDKDVEWDPETDTAYIDEKGALKITQIIPFSNQNDFYPQFGFINLVFDREMKACSELTNISLTSSNGEKVNLSAVKPGITLKTNMLFVLGNDLKLDTEYVLSVPRNTLESADGRKYVRDIKIKFKTAHTVLFGRYSSSSQIKSVTVTNGKKVYDTHLSGDNTFMATNIEGGKSIIKITNMDGKVYEKEISIESGMLNMINVVPEFK